MDIGDFAKTIERPIAAVAVLFALLAYLAQPLLAQSASLETAIPAVVRIRGCDTRGCDRGLGSGVIIHPAGVILTANHVTLSEPTNPASDRLSDFVIELSDDVRLAPVGRYRAELIAFDIGDDLALLRIYRDELTNRPLAELAGLPSIPLADLTQISLGEKLQILGYPLEGGAAINYAAAAHGGYKEEGALIKIQSQLSPGNSGGPVLVEQAGELRIAGIVVERRGAISFLRSIDQLGDLQWLPDARRVWASNVGVYHSPDDDVLTLQLDLHALDFVDQQATILAYAYSTDRRKLTASVDTSHRTAGGHAVFAAAVKPEAVVENVAGRQYSLSMRELGARSQELLLRFVLWDPVAQRVLWRDPTWYQPESRPQIAERSPAATETTNLAPSTPSPSPFSAGEVRTFAGIEFVHVPAGDFLMGSSRSDSSAAAGEMPQRSVYLDGYWIMRTEVTNAMYAQCVAAGGCRAPANERWNDILFAQYPVTHVNWIDARSFSNWLSTNSGREMALPTEAQWEKAARGTDGRIYPWGNTFAPGHANISGDEDAYVDIAPVGSFAEGASPYGVLDMAGNVWEWTADRYARGYYADAPDQNPRGPGEGLKRIMRGGSWLSSSDDVRSALRVGLHPNGRLESYGFRVVTVNDASEISMSISTTSTPTETPAVTTTDPAATTTPMPTTTAPMPSEPAAGTTRDIGGVGFVYVPAGEFKMGSTSVQGDAALVLCNRFIECDRSMYFTEEPQHTVYVDGFWIMRTEVTNAMYAACVAAQACREPEYARWNDAAFADHPVVDVSWDDAVNFAEWLSIETSATIGLPTEAEWEKAARGIEGGIFPWGDDWDPTKANYCDASCDQEWADSTNDDNFVDTAPVGSFVSGASPYGVLDMAGNVWEWTADRFAGDYYARSPRRNPTGPGSGEGRVLRGGSWHNDPDALRSAGRAGLSPDSRNVDLGFRLASPGF